MQTPPLIYAVTVNYKRPQDTIECLDSLMRQEKVHLGIVVVDNGSKDDSIPLILKAHPEVTLLQTDKNLGFAGGYNTGIRFALTHDADYVLIVNNDTILHPEMVARLVENDTETVGCLAPAIFYASQPEKVWSLGGKVSLLTFDMTDHHGRNMPFPAGPIDRDFLSGCCLLIRRQVLESVGLLDEDFFFCYEDQDYSFRVREHGYRMVLVPQARLWHKVSVSSGGSDSPVERYWMGRSSVLYFRKHVHGIRWLFVIPWRVASTIKTTLHLLLKHKPGSALAYIKGEWTGLVR